jgi:hypothetical protein
MVFSAGIVLPAFLPQPTKSGNPIRDFTATYIHTYLKLPTRHHGWHHESREGVHKKGRGYFHKRVSSRSPAPYVELWYKIHVEKKGEKKAERLFPH